MLEQRTGTRRDFIRVAAAAASTGGVVVTGSGLLARADEQNGGGKKQEEEEVSPAEDLMREHGVLKRVLLVYDEAIRRIDAKDELPPDPLLDAAKLVRAFVEDYHEKLEEDFLFPRFRKANKLVALVDVLAAQHDGGRRLTDLTLRYANLKSLRDAGDRSLLRDSLARFVRMYNPHEAREDTVLFPAFRKVVGKHEYDALGDDFEKKEHELFGDDGFEKMVDRVANIEKALGVYDLAQFTPKA
jgi:hemerythrin-like domain-containing protein